MRLYIILLLFCFSLAGCFLTPCTTTLTIISDDDAEVMLITDNNIITNYIIEKYFNQYFDKTIMNEIEYIYIKTASIDGLFELREYDHWFPGKHDIEISIENDQFILNKSGKNVYSVYSYAHWDDGIDFEMFKKQRYNDIYDYIKNSDGE